MKAVILAGGLGTRISEESSVRPKPMIEIGGKPILWHIMKIYSSYGVRDFIVCCGYKGYVIKEYFANYYLHTCDVTFRMSENRMEVHQSTTEPWNVTLVDTGDQTSTGGRLRRVEQYLRDEKEFFFTYGDGVGDVDLRALLALHQREGTLATVTAVQPPGRFGYVEIEGAKVTNMVEKPDGDGRWINGGFFVLSPRTIEYVEGDDTVWERAPMERLAAERQLATYQHRGFWHPMDTMRDKSYLEELWASGRAPWKVW